MTKQADMHGHAVRHVVGSIFVCTAGDVWVDHGTYKVGSTAPEMRMLVAALEAAQATAQTYERVLEQIVRGAEEAPVGLSNPATLARDALRASAQKRSSV